jgi:excisionase family DNA binding protein
MDRARRWISCREAAAYLSVHPMTIRDWVNRGLVPSARIGRCVRIDLRALEAKLEGQRGGSGQAET